MMITAAERAAQILAARIAGMRQKANPAVAAERHAHAQMRMGRQHQLQGQLILLNKRLGAAVLLPILAKSKYFRDGYYKRARFSVMIESC